MLCKVYGFCEYISFAGNETCMLTSFSNDKMYAKKVSIYIDFLSTGANGSRFNNGEAEILVDH